MNTAEATVSLEHKIRTTIKNLEELRPELKKLTTDIMLEPINDGSGCRTTKLYAIPGFHLITKHFTEHIGDARGAISTTIEQLNSLLALERTLDLLKTLTTNNVSYLLAHHRLDQPPIPGSAVLSATEDD